MVILQYKSHKPERKQVTRRCTHHGFPGKMGGTKTVGRLLGRVLENTDGGARNAKASTIPAEP